MHRIDAFLYSGNESQCLVEYAAYQKVPNALKKTKKDPKSNTIDEDPDFMAFVEEFQKQEHQLETPEQFLEKIEKKEREAKLREQNTNLLNFIKENKAEKQRIRQEKYEARKKRDDERKKARQRPDRKEQRKDIKDRQKGPDLANKNNSDEAQGNTEADKKPQEKKPSNQRFEKKNFKGKDGNGSKTGTDLF